MTLACVVAPSKSDLSLAQLDMEEEVDIEKELGNHIMEKQQDPLFETDSTPASSFVSFTLDGDQLEVGCFVVVDWSVS